jgi:hypothetical protein
VNRCVGVQRLKRGVMGKGYPIGKSMRSIRGAGDHRRQDNYVRHSLQYCPVIESHDGKIKTLLIGMDFIRKL